MPAKIEAMMDNRDSCGELSIDQITRAVGETQQLSAMSNDTIFIKQMIADIAVARGTADNRQYQIQRGRGKHMRLLREITYVVTTDVCRPRGSSPVYLLSRCTHTGTAVTTLKIYFQ